eukprot:gene7452-9158_t
MNTNTTTTTATTTTTTNNDEEFKTIKILIASDIHLAFNNIQKLGTKMLERKEDLNYLFCPGDMCNFNPINCDNAQLVSTCEGEMSAVIAALENVYRTVIYVPGNHDAKTTLLNKEKPRLTSYSKNLHKSCFRLSDDLVMLGLGGSLPGYSGGVKVWQGYPYQSDDELRLDLEETFENAKNTLVELPDGTKEPLLKDTDKILLFTHVGPSSSSTTLDQRELYMDDDKLPVHSGSKAINDFILKHNKTVFLHIHGHTHHALGMARVGKSFIVNPGSLRTGHYAILTIENYCNHIWRLKSCEFQRL